MTVSARRWLYEPLRVTGQTVSQTDAAMALTDQNRCPFCKTRMTDETCPCWNKEEQ